MGQTARETKKSPQPVRIRLTEDLEERVNQAWREGPHRDIDRQQFLLILLRLGIAAHDQTHSLEERLDDLEELVRFCVKELKASERDPGEASGR